MTNFFKIKKCKNVLGKPEQNFTFKICKKWTYWFCTNGKQGRFKNIYSFDYDLLVNKINGGD